MQINDMNRQLATVAAAAIVALVAPLVIRAEPEIHRRFNEWEWEMHRRARGEITDREAPPPELVIAAPLDVAEPPLNGEWSPTGLVTKMIEAGNGDEPARINDTVTLHFTGWTAAGYMFDTTAQADEPTQYVVSKILPGLTEGLQMMFEGETRRMWIPQHLAFDGETGLPEGMVCFDVELISIDERGVLPPPDVDRIPENAITLDSGLAYRIIEPGDGEKHPGPEDAVQVHITAFRPDGRVIDDTRKRGLPTSFALDRTTLGFAEAIPMMVRGEQRRMWMPEELANLEEEPRYVGMLVFDVELIDFVEKPERPPDITGIPADAERTETGLAYRVLRPGTGDRHPAYNDTVVVDYAGWTVDGKRFDSSYDHGTVGKFKLDQNKPMGWNEAMQLMVVGEKCRIWIPQELAYGNVEGRPKGMLVFDVELLEIQEN